MHRVSDDDGVIPNEYDQELQWSTSRKFSMSHAFTDGDKEDDERKLQVLIENYGIDRISSAKE